LTGKRPFKERETLSEERYREAREKYGDGFVVAQGADAIRELLKNTDVKELSKKLRAEMKETSPRREAPAGQAVEGDRVFLESGNKPEWMILEVIPVIPRTFGPLCLSTGDGSQPRT